MPATALSNAPAGMKPMTAERPQVPATRESSQGGTGVPDAARRRVDEERQRIDPFSSADEDARRAEAKSRVEPRLAKRVGYFDGSTIIFVDLVDQKTQRELLRIFGPSQPPKPDPKDPEEASRAYEAASGNGRRDQSSSMSA
jgi:hypothetical protein